MKLPGDMFKENKSSTEFKKTKSKREGEEELKVHSLTSAESPVFIRETILRLKSVWFSQSQDRRKPKSKWNLSDFKTSGFSTTTVFVGWGSWACLLARVRFANGTRTPLGKTRESQLDYKKRTSA